MTQLSSLLAGITAVTVQAKPNVLLIVADDLGYSDISCYGNDRVQTPHIDTLAEQGTKMTSFYAAGPVCTPTRASIISGKYPLRHDIQSIFRDKGEFLPNRNNMPQLFQQAGYHTALLGKWHLGGLRMKERSMRDKVPGPHEHGFDDYLCQIEEYPLRGKYFKDETIYRKGGQCMLRNEEQLTESDPYYNMYFSDIMGEESIRLINEYQNTDKPFFMELCFMAPHMPYEPAPEPHWSATAAEGISEKQHRIRSMIARMDYQIGRVVSEIDKLGIADNTVVVFTSDNGGHKESNNGPFRGYKSDLYEGGIRVPFIMRWPGKIPANEVTTEFGHTNDILPTLCSAAGIALPSDGNYDGTDIMPALKGGKMNTADKTHFWYFDKFAGKKKKKKKLLTGVARQGDWKLFFSYGEMKALYNLKDDPKETKNKLSAFPEIASGLKIKYDQWQNEPRTKFGFVK